MLRSLTIEIFVRTLHNRSGHPGSSIIPSSPRSLEATARLTQSTLSLLDGYAAAPSTFEGLLDRVFDAGIVLSACKPQFDAVGAVLDRELRRGRAAA